MKWIKKTHLRCISLCFGVCLSFYWSFWLYCVTAVTRFTERSEGLACVAGAKRRGEGEKHDPFFPFSLSPTPLNACYAGHEGWSLQSGMVLDQSQQEYRFFAEIQIRCQCFSSSRQEGNLLFLSGRSDWKKIHNFPIKSSHLCWTSRHVWLSSSACDHCCAYQLICNYGN